METNDDPTLPYGRSYWVSRGKLMAGYLPGAQHTVESIESDVNALINSGVRSIVNLMLEFDQKDPAIETYDKYFLMRCAELKFDANWKCFPIMDMSLTEEAHMIEILDYIDAEIEEGRIVYVHCFMGLGRTGLVVGCWLIRHGLATADDFIDKIKELRVNDIAGFAESPQTEAQVGFVKSWGREK